MTNSTSIKQYQVQKQFNLNADSKRFFNRISNPFIIKKEMTLAKKIASIFSSDNKARILEIGCGEGNNYLFLQNYLPPISFVGLDFSLSKVNFMKKMLNNSHALCGDATKLPFESNSFDGVIIRDLLHHVNWARNEVLLEAIRTLKTNGKIVIVESNGENLFNIVFQFFFPAERGLKDSTPQKLFDLCSKFGNTSLDFIESSFLLRSLAFFGGWPKGFFRFFLYIIYSIASIWEKFSEKFCNKEKWPYMLLTIRKN